MTPYDVARDTWPFLSRKARLHIDEAELYLNAALIQRDRIRADAAEASLALQDGDITLVRTASRQQLADLHLLVTCVHVVYDHLDRLWSQKQDRLPKGSKAQIKRARRQIKSLRELRNRLEHAAEHVEWNPVALATRVGETFSRGGWAIDVKDTIATLTGIWEALVDIIQTLPRRLDFSDETRGTYRLVDVATDTVLDRLDDDDQTTTMERVFDLIGNAPAGIRIQQLDERGGWQTWLQIPPQEVRSTGPTT